MLIFLLTFMFSLNSAEETYGGEKACRGQFPYHVGLKMYSESGSAFICSGSITAKNWILTAGHCVKDKISAQIISGSVNINNYDEDSQIRSATKGDFYLHPKFESGSFVNDIALIFVRDLKFSDTVQQVQLAYSNETFENFDSFVAGWGMIDSKSQLDENLRYTKLMVQSVHVCNKFYSGVDTEKQLCLRTTKDSSSCPGDSGGPLVLANNMKYEQVGIVSFGENCTNGDPAVFTRVSPYRNFIEQTMISRYCSMGSCLGLPGRN